MKIEKVNNNKIKVTVTPDEMQQWGVDFESLAGNSPEARDLFWNLIKKAEFETGFVVDNSQLIVEAMPLKNDGIVLFVTRIDEDYDSEKYGRIKIRRPRYRVKKHVLHDDNTVILYSFNNFDDLCEFSKQWQHLGENSNLYSYGGLYYLALHFENQFFDHEFVENKLLEFAKKVDSPRISEAYLKEYGVSLSEGNALLTIANHF